MTLLRSRSWHRSFVLSISVLLATVLGVSLTSCSPDASVSSPVGDQPPASEPDAPHACTEEARQVSLLVETKQPVGQRNIVPLPDPTLES